MTGRSVADTVALALKQAALLRDPLPETRALLALRADPTAAALLGWLDTMPGNLPVEYRVAVGDATSRQLAAMHPDTTPDFWEEYLRLRATGRAEVGLPAAPIDTPSAAKPKGGAHVAQVDPDKARERLVGLRRMKEILEALRSAPHHLTYPQVLEQVHTIGLSISVSSLTSLGNGYALKHMEKGKGIFSARKEAEILAALELLAEEYLSAKPAAPVASEPGPAPEPEIAPSPASAPAAPSPARVRAPAPPTTDKERRALAERMGRESGSVDARDFAKACRIHMGAAFSALTGYPFLAPARGTSFPYRA